MKKLTVIIFGIILGGCASAPDLQGIRYIEPPKNNKGSFVVIREKSIPYKVYARVKVDNVLSAYLPDGHVTWIQVEPGEHQVKIEFPPLAGMRDLELSLNAKSGGVNYLKYEGGDSGRTIPVFTSGGTFSGTVNLTGKRRRLEIIDEDTAKTLLSRLLYIPARID